MCTSGQRAGRPERHGCGDGTPADFGGRGHGRLHAAATGLSAGVACHRARCPSHCDFRRPEAAAAWAEIGVARGNRLPRLDLAAVLTGQWIRAAGSTLNLTTWSVGPALTGTQFDGGAGAANVCAAQARYRHAVARLQGTLRTTVEDVESVLAARASAQDRTVSASEAAAISLFELEDSRRQFASAEDAEISAWRDRAQAWMALVKATGGAVTLNQESTAHE